MTQVLAMLRANPALIVLVAFLAITTLVFGVLAVMMTRAGASLRPLVFLATFFAIVVGPQAAFHLAQAFDWIPKRSLTWVAARDRAVAAYTEDDAALATSDGVFTNPRAVFGPDADLDLVSDLLQLGPASPFAGALVAQMAMIPPGGTTMVARYATASDARDAAERYLVASVGSAPAPGRDGAVTMTRPVGDVIKVLAAGRTLLVLTGATEREVSARLEAAPVTATREESPGSAAARDFWLYRPAVLAALTLLLVAVATLWFFKGSSWASTVPAVAGVEPLRGDALRRQLLAVNQVDAPLTVEEEQPGGRIVVTWRFADAKWVDIARAHGLRRTHRLLLELDEARRVVRPTEQLSALDWSAGPQGGGVQWRTGMGITFFQVEHQRVFGLQLDKQGRFIPQLSYAYTFNLQEMKAPFVAATTQAGWDWRPTAWHGPTWLRWLTN